MPPDPRVHITRDWIEKVQHDLLSADLLAGDTRLTDTMAFHCQFVFDRLPADVQP